jgi:Tfp pilus assembly protein PilO
MKKIVISILLMSFIFNFANAEEVKQTKEVKQINKKELSEEDKLIAQFIKSNNESKELDKVEKTLDKMNKQLEKDKK